MNIAVIGAHPGDVEFVSGAIVHKYVNAGHQVHALVLTNADHGNKGVSPEIYGKQTFEESRKASEILKTHLHFFERSSGTVSVTPERIDELARLLEKIAPSFIITHGPSSFHRDHTVTNYLVRHTLYMNKSLSGIPFFYPENREDNQEFRPEYFVRLDQPDIDAWEEASMCFECFRKSFYNFDYHRYYKQLFCQRGAEAHTQYASCFMRGIPERGLTVLDSMPGFPL